MGSGFVEVGQELRSGVLITYNALAYESLHLETPIVEHFKFPSLSRYGDSDHESLVTNAPDFVLDVTTFQLGAQIEELLVAHRSIVDRQTQRPGTPPSRRLRHLVNRTYDRLKKAADNPTERNVLER